LYNKAKKFEIKKYDLKKSDFFLFKNRDFFQPWFSPQLLAQVY